MNNSTRISAQSPQEAKVEEFDLVILGGGAGSTIAAWTFVVAEREAVVR